MADEKKPIGRDATGYEVVTSAIKDLLNQFPGILDGEEIKFEELPEDDAGIAFFNNTGALVYSEHEDIIGCVHQECRYPFFVVYRLASSFKEHQKQTAFEFLERLGKWICKEPVTVDGTDYKLTDLPALSGGREIKRITRDNVYGTEPQQNGVQDWLLPVTVSYTNEFEL